MSGDGRHFRSKKESLLPPSHFYALFKHVEREQETEWCLPAEIPGEAEFRQVMLCHLKSDLK